MASQDTRVTLGFVGDIALGNHPKTPGFGFFSRYSNGIPSSILRRLRPDGVNLDLMFGNLEFALSERSKIPGGVDSRCCGVVDYAESLAQAGVTVLNVANNHSWEYGRDAFESTVKAIRSVGIRVVGTPDDFDGSSYLRLKGVTIAILGWSARPRQGFSDTPKYNEFEESTVLGRIREARSLSDLVCVSIHWGDEFVSIPSDREIKWAKSMIDAGADLIIGHHPHVLREVVRHGRGLVAYSLGNFLGDMTWNPLNRQSGCLVVHAGRSGLLSHEFLPAVIQDDFFPEFLDGARAQEFLACQEHQFSRTRAEISAVGYQETASRALRSHQRLTARFVMRNLSRYRLGTLARIVSHAVRVRANW